VKSPDFAFSSVARCQRCRCGSVVGLAIGKRAAPAISSKIEDQAQVIFSNTVYVFDFDLLAYCLLPYWEMTETLEREMI
jgi:hypothetical protein